MEELRLTATTGVLYYSDPRKPAYSFLLGLSTDTKPASPPNGWTFLELDTGFLFKSSGGAWATSGAAPGAHATTHQNGGTDEISVAGLSGLLADGQTPLSHTHAISDTTNLQTSLDSKAPLANPTFTGVVTAPVVDLPRTGGAETAGNATLVGGTITVNTTSVTTNDVVILTRKTSGGTIGTAITYTINTGVSFTITSDNVLDTSTFSWIIIKTH